jgi:uncharacterized protein involved in outer membrane biogenesis
MHKGRRKGWIVAAAVLLLLAGVAATGASAFLSSDRAHQYLLHKMEESSGRRLHADTLALRLTPSLNIDAAGFSIANPGWARSGPDFLRAETASLKIRLLPLLIGQIRIANMEIDGAQLFLERNATAANWHFQPSDAENAATSGNGDATNGETKPTQSTDVLPSHVLIRRASLHYRGVDGQTRFWQLPSATLDVGTGISDKVQADLQIVAGDRIVHVHATTNDLINLQKGLATPFLIHAEVPGQAAAGQLHAEGILGFGKNLPGTDLRVHIDAPDNNPWQVLAGYDDRHLAAIKLDFSLRGQDDGVLIQQLAFSIGTLHVTGQGGVHAGADQHAAAATVPAAPPRFHIEAQLRTDYLDWAQITRDLGLPQPPPKPPGALFRNVPLAWPLLEKIKGFTADVDLQMSVLTLRSGLPLQNVRMQMLLQPDQLRLPVFAADFMGGKASADAVFTAHDKNVRLHLKAAGVSLEQWREVLHKPKLLSGGPLAVDASVSATGDTISQLAATMTGPVNLRLGHMVVHSARASEAELALTGLIPALAGNKADHLDVVCLVASLPFDNGRATGNSLVGARTESSQLLTAGIVNLQDQTLDLHGRVTGAEGLALGASTFAGAVNINGKLVKPKFRLDARGVAGTLARVGAAILTFGLSAVGQTIWDASADDACKRAAK